MTQGSYRSDSGMTWEYLRDSGRVWDMTVAQECCMGIHDQDDVPEPDTGEQQGDNHLLNMQIRVADLPSLVSNPGMPSLSNYS